MQKGLLGESRFNAILHHCCFSILTCLGCFLPPTRECACPALCSLWAAGRLARAARSQHPLVPWPELDGASLAVHSESLWVCSLTPALSVMGPIHFTSVRLFLYNEWLDQISSEVPCCPNSRFYFYFLMVTTGVRHVRGEGSHRG